MRPAFLTVFGVFLSVSALAAEWTEIAEFPEFVAEVDTRSFRAPGSSVEEAQFRFNYYSARTNPKTGAQYLSAEVTGLFDCANKRFSAIERTEFKGNKSSGPKVGSIVIPTADIKFIDILPGSMNEIMFNAACPR